MPKLRRIPFLLLQLLFCLYFLSTISIAGAAPAADAGHEANFYDGPTAEEWEVPRAWNVRRQFTRAISPTECWPRVKFGLLQSTSGCPNGNWQTGSVRHLLRATSSVSSPNYLQARIAADSVELHFCMRDPDPADADRDELDCRAARPEPAFPPGSYCLFNGQKANAYERCPAGFHWSAMGVDDVGYVADREGVAAAANVPTGEFFPTFSHYYLCCRNDSAASEPIILPKARSFILFPLNAEKRCQEVRDMKARLFSLFLDTETESYVGSPDKGNAPYAATEVVVEAGQGGSCSGDRYGKGLKMHLCYYSSW